MYLLTLISGVSGIDPGKEPEAHLLETVAGKISMEVPRETWLH
jgi:hypothetical protein